jgi:hypothetical protein
MFYRRFGRILPVVAALRRRHFAFLVCAAVEEVSERDRGDRVKCTAKDHFVKMRKNGEKGFKIAVADGLLLYYDKFSFYSQKVKVGGGGGRRHESRSPIRWMFRVITTRRLCKKAELFRMLLLPSQGYRRTKRTKMGIRQSGFLNGTFDLAETYSFKVDSVSS